jgi:hypothetical protein
MFGRAVGCALVESLACDYPAAWNAYRRRWRLFLGSWIGLLPACLLVGVPLSGLIGSRMPFVVVAVAGMIAMTVSTGLVILWRCPRCGNRFHRKGTLSNCWARRCLHCGLLKRSAKTS